jgi:hypothetical protein
MSIDNSPKPICVVSDGSGTFLSKASLELVIQLCLRATELTHSRSFQRFDSNRTSQLTSHLPSDRTAATTHTNALPALTPAELFLKGAQR